MIERGGDAVVLEQVGQFLGLLPVADIHDARSGNAVAHGQELPGLVLALPDDVGQVRPLETALEKVLLLESETVHDVVVRPEVIAPLRDAVRLVHDDERDGEDGQVTLEKPGLEPFGGDIQEFAFAVGGVVQGKVHFVSAESGMDGDGLDSTACQVLDLVLHQGDEGRDHEREAVAHHGRHLETHRFPASGGEDGEHVAARKRLFDDALLHRPEAFMPPIGFQCLERCHFFAIVRRFNCKYLVFLINLQN